MSIRDRSSAALELLATISVAMVAVSVGLRLANGSMDLHVGLTAILLAPEAYWPVRRVGQEFHNAADGAAVLDAVRPYLDADRDAVQTRDEVVAPSAGSRLAPPPARTGFAGGPGGRGPVARHTEHTSPGVRDRYGRGIRKEIPQQCRQRRDGPLPGRAIGFDPRSVAVRHTAAPESDAVIGRAGRSGQLLWQLGQ